VREVAARLGRGAATDARGRYRIPVAVTITRCDGLLDLGLIPQDSVWAQGEMHGHQYWHGVWFDRQLRTAISHMFEDLIREWAPAAHRAIVENFAHYTFLGVSATGCWPDRNGTFPGITPLRVEEPLLWLLWKNGQIRG
jgi:hypothetical protein